MSGYTKLFASLIHSTVWQEDAGVKVVWITMLAMADRDGVVHASVPGLAKAAGVPLEACEAALSKFLAPDPYSRTPDNEGRRIGKVAGGWELLNYLKYRLLMDADDQREKTAARVRKFRARNAARNAVKRSVTLGNGCNDIAKAKAEAEAELGTPPLAGDPPTLHPSKTTVVDGEVRDARLRSPSASPRADQPASGTSTRRPGKDAPTGLTAPRGRSRPRTPLPVDFVLTADMAEYAQRKRSWPPERIVAVYEDFIGKSLARGYVYADWQQAWQNWVRGEGKYDSPASGTDGGTPRYTPGVDRGAHSTVAFQRQMQRMLALEMEEAEEKKKAAM